MKKLIMLLLAGAMVFSLVGCSSKEENKVKELLKVDMDYAMAHEGLYFVDKSDVYSFCDDTYSFGDENLLAKNNKDDLLPAGFFANESRDKLFLTCSFEKLPFTIYYGDIPVYQMTSETAVIYTGEDYKVKENSETMTLVMCKVELRGYTIPMSIEPYDFFEKAGHYDPSRLTLYNSGTAIGHCLRCDESDLPGLLVKDKHNKVVSDIFSLEKGETYTVTWFKGDNKMEMEFQATCPLYVKSDIADLEKYFVVDAKRTGDGYWTFDLSSVPKGIYRFLECDAGFSFIEIK